MPLSAEIPAPVMTRTRGLCMFAKFRVVVTATTTEIK
jgi:hypothetical protein